MKTRTAVRTIHRCLVLSLTALVLANCARSAPDDPKPEPVATDACLSALVERGPSQTTSPTILGVCDNERLLVVFSSFQGGKAVEIQPDDLSLAIARLVTDASSPAGYWQSYINRVETPVIGEWPGTEAALQANTERGGTLTSLGEGLYAYALTTDVKSVTQPVEVSWVPEATHRVGLEFRGSVMNRRLGNPVYTWVPAGESVTSPTMRDIVATQSCNECHGNLAVHGGARNEVEYCVLCHNPGTTDANSGHTMNLSSLVHKIHRSGGLPTQSFIVWGHNDTKYDFSNAGYPQDSRNCLKCHSGAIESTPQGDAWKTVSIEACTTCHDNLTFDENPTITTAHLNRTNADCTTCHGPGKARSPELAHMTPYPTPNNPMVPQDLPVIVYELLSVSLENGTQPVASFRILADGDPLDVQDLPTWATSLPNLKVAHAVTEGTVANPSDFNNKGNLREQPRSFGIAALAANLVAESDGSFTTTAGQLGDVPAGSSMVAVLMDGYINVDRNGDGTGNINIGADSVLMGVDIEGSPRREIADINRCNACHERLSLHGGNRVNNLQVCATCHNPNATDHGRRPATTADGLPERSVALSTMIHSIHMGKNLSADKYVVYGFNNIAHDFKRVNYPNDIANCETCHFPGTYDLPLDSNALAITLLTGADKASPDDDSNVSPAGAACAACHDSAYVQAHAMATIAHASTNLSGTENDSCALCHGPGKPYDASRAHRIPDTGSQLAPIMKQLMAR